VHVSPPRSGDRLRSESSRPGSTSGAVAEECGTPMCMKAIVTQVPDLWVGALFAFFDGETAGIQLQINCHCNPSMHQYELIY